jgi:8-oxo-dGTP pyrophosphatase MutT (NUDIX family)
MTNEIKPKAICIFRHQDEILVSEYQNPQTNEPFFRPLGGSIEFGENSSIALQREIAEEIGAEIDNLKFLGVIENIYTNKGEQKHELLFIYDAEFINQNLYRINSFSAFEGERKFKVHWIKIADFANGKLQLYPIELLDMILENEIFEQSSLIQEEEIELSS